VRQNANTPAERSSGVGVWYSDAILLRCAKAHLRS